MTRSSSDFGPATSMCPPRQASLGYPSKVKSKRTILTKLSLRSSRQQIGPHKRPPILWALKPRRGADADDQRVGGPASDIRVRPGHSAVRVDDVLYIGLHIGLRRKLSLVA